MVVVVVVVLLVFTVVVICVVAVEFFSSLISIYLLSVSSFALPLIALISVVTSNRLEKNLVIFTVVLTSVVRIQVVHQVFLVCVMVLLLLKQI